MFSGLVERDIERLIETNSRLSSQTTRQQSEDFIHKQLAAFERLLLHSISRFSKDNLYYMLRHVFRWTQSEHAQRGIHQNETKSAVKMKSIQQLRECVKSMKEKRTHKSVEDEHVYKYFDLFLNDLLYLKDLKKYFDDEIYKSLMKYHYDPSIGKNKAQSLMELDSPRVKMKGRKRYTARDTDDDDSGHGSQAESGENSKDSSRLKTGKAATTVGPVTTEAETRYRDSVCELQDILKKWDGLLSEDVLNLNDFDPDSYHELMQFTNYSQFEPVLRLVPDIFAKCYKCIELAKAWLRESNAVLKDVPLPSSPNNDTDENETEQLTSNEKQSTPREFTKEVREIRDRLNDVEQSIDNDERQLEQYKREMNQLASRDDRYSKLSSEFNKMDSILTLAAGNYQKSKTEQYALSSKLRGCPKDSYDYTDLKEKLRNIDKEVSENHWKMKLLEFEKTMVEEDYIVESGVRPSFIRFIGDTKDKMQDLQEEVSTKKEEKMKLEKQLALMKTNTDRMKNIMRTYLGSAETRTGLSMRREITLSTQASDGETDELSESLFDDGNETDIDSVGPYDNSPRTYKNSTPLYNETDFQNTSAVISREKSYKKIPDRYENLQNMAWNQVDTYTKEDTTETDIKSPAKYGFITPLPTIASLKDSPGEKSERYEVVEPVHKDLKSKDVGYTRTEATRPYNKGLGKYGPISEINKNYIDTRKEKAQLSRNRQNRIENVWPASVEVRSKVAPIRKDENQKRRPKSFRIDTSTSNTVPETERLQKLKNKQCAKDESIFISR